MVLGITSVDRKHFPGQQKTYVDAQQLLADKGSADFKISGNKLKIDNLPPKAKLTITVPDLNSPTKERKLEFVNETNENLTARFYFDDKGIYTTDQTKAIETDPNHQSLRQAKHADNKQYLIDNNTPNREIHYGSTEKPLGSLPGIISTHYDREIKQIKNTLRELSGSQPPRVDVGPLKAELASAIDELDQKGDKEAYEKLLAVLAKVLEKNRKLHFQYGQHLHAIERHVGNVNLGQVSAFAKLVLSELETVGDETESHFTPPAAVSISEQEAPEDDDATFFSTQSHHTEASKPFAQALDPSFSASSKTEKRTNSEAAKIGLQGID